MKGKITAAGINDANKINKNLIFKNNAPFGSCISKLNNTFLENAENIDIVMPMYNLLEYSDNFSITSGSLWNYYRDSNYRVNNDKTLTSKSFEYKTKIIRSAPVYSNILDTEAVVPLKHFSNFWRSLDFPLINSEAELDCHFQKIA